MGKTESEIKSSSKFKKKKKYRSSSSSSSISSLSSLDEKTKKKLKKKAKKLMKKEKKKEKRVLKKLSKKKDKGNDIFKEKKILTSGSSHDTDIGLIQQSKNLAPMTKEEWEKQQNTFNRVFDKVTGRMRLVKGTGEIVEECVSKKRHLMINKQATKGDGEFFQKTLSEKLK